MNVMGATVSQASCCLCPLCSQHGLDLSDVSPPRLHVILDVNGFLSFLSPLSPVTHFISNRLYSLGVYLAVTNAVLVWYHQTIELALAIDSRFCSTNSICGWSIGGQSRSADYILHFTAPSHLANRAATLDIPLGLAGTTPYLQTNHFLDSRRATHNCDKKTAFDSLVALAFPLIFPRLHPEPTLHFTH